MYFTWALFAVAKLIDFNNKPSVKRYLDTTHSIKQSSVQENFCLVHVIWLLSRLNTLPNSIIRKYRMVFKLFVINILLYYTIMLCNIVGNWRKCKVSYSILLLLSVQIKFDEMYVI